MPNRLINETSPYLQQHAYNPVDWYSWGEEALEESRKKDKPIFLSIGYSACHWCHVMERESFENEDIAQIMNENFVNIKVDREERPDLDSIYMQAVQALTGRGGWPMSVFLTPEGKPFYGGTYFPPEDHGGMPGFPRVLKALAEAYRSQRGEVAKSAERLANHMRQASQAQRSSEPLTQDILYQAYKQLASQFDGSYGGFGQAPKFPQPMVYEFLLRYYLRSGEPQALEMVTHTLTRMALGGIYDQLGGGFHRYSTDALWLVPHFEKMLYDNALLARLYLHAYQVTGEHLYRRITEETLDYALREMMDSSGGFYSAQDADSEGIEGKYFIWREEEINNLLDLEEDQLFCRYFGVTQEGNFEGHSILYIPENPETLAREAGVTLEQLRDVIERGKAKLVQVRQHRVAPGTDTKVLTAWNGLMLKSLAEAAAVLDNETYREAAIKNATFLLGALRRDGRLLRTFKDGQAKIKGYLEDHAFLIDGLLALHEATFDQRWLEEAIVLGEQILDLFWDETQGVFYDTGKDQEALVVRPRDIFDSALPCGSSMAADVLLRLGIISGNPEFSRRAVATLRTVRELLVQAPMGMAHWLCTLDFYLSAPKEIAIIGSWEAADTKGLAREVFRRFLPNKVLVGQESDTDGYNENIALLQERTMIDGRPTAYVCENYTCQMPVTDPDALATQLSE